MLILAARCVSPAAGAGVVTNADEASLVAAMNGGGTVTFACNGIIVLSNTLEISNNLVLDATGHTIALSGSNACQIFTIDNGVTLDATNLAFVDALNQATDTNTGPPFNFQIINGGLGGAIENSGTFLAVQCEFTNCAARGLDGYVDFNGNQFNGSEGLGGAIYNLGQLALVNCVFANNKALGGDGTPGYGQASIYNPRDGFEGGGGAVYNAGTATVVNCIFSNNAAGGGAGGMIQNNASFGRAFTYGASGGPGNGGAFCNDGAAFISASTFATNEAVGGAGGDGGPGDNPYAFMGSVTAGGPGGDGANGIGAGLCNENGTLAVVNSTLAGNFAVGSAGGAGGNGTDAEFEAPPTTGGNGGNGGNGGSGLGGGIGLYGGSAALTNLTLAWNTTIAGALGAGGSGGNGSGASAGANGFNGTAGFSEGQSIAVAGGSAILLNSILDCTTNTPNGYGGINDAGYNMATDSTGFLTNGASFNGDNPQLGLLRNNGGPTPTVALLPGSPAINAANPVAFPPTDQRGFPRPYGAGPDIGAFEFGTIIWTNPAPIIYGTPLSSNQLNATAIIPGTFVYTPSLGSNLTAGTQTLSLVFAPTDTNNFNSLTDTVSLVVLPAPLTVVAANALRLVGATNPVFTGVITGVTNGDNILPAFSTTATAGSPEGNYPITPTLIDPGNRETNYSVTLVAGVLEVGQLPAVVTPPQGLVVNTGGVAAFSVFAQSATLPAVSSGALQLWLKADAGVVTNGSGKVSQWQDQSGNSNHASQATATMQPALVAAAGLNGAAAIRFNGIQDNTNGSILSATNQVGLSNAMTAFTVYGALSTVNTTNILWDIGAPGQNGAVRASTIVGGDLAFWFWGTNFSLPLPIATNSYRLETDRLDTNLNALDVFDVTPSGATNFSLSISGATNAGAGYFVGGVNPSLPGVGGSRCFNGDVAEWLVFNGSLIDSDRLAVAGYLQEKYFQGTNGALSYQWRINGASIAGATRSAFGFSNAVPTDGGDYDVNVSDNYGTVASAKGHFTVNYIIATSEGLPQQFAASNLTAVSHVQPGNAFSVTSVDAASQQGGSEQLTNNAITYTPPAGFTGVDVFHYVLTPTNGAPITNTVTVLVDACMAVSDVESGGQATVQFASAIPNVTYKIQASVDLLNWVTIGTATAAPGGTFQFIDPQAGLYSHRFYRTSLP